MLSDLLQTIQISVKSLVSLWCGGFAICGAVVFWCGRPAICGAVAIWCSRCFFCGAAIILHRTVVFCGAATILYGFVVFAWITFGGRTVCCRFFRIFTRLCCCVAF